jgi:redox-sensitive bicupin YhaK (pirin superfamily)
MMMRLAQRRAFRRTAMLTWKSSPMSAQGPSATATVWAMKAGRPAAMFLYLVPATGRITINGVPANARDGIAITGETRLVIEAEEEAELVLVDAR